MAFPTATVSTGLAETASASGDRNVTVPTCASGDLLIAVVCSDGNPNFAGTLTTNMTSFVAKAANGTLVTSQCFYRICDGGESSPWVLNLDASEAAVVAFILIPAATWHGTTPPEGVAWVNVDTANPDPPSLDPAGWGAEDTLWIAVSTHDLGTVTHSAYPTNYADDQSDIRGNNASSVGIGIATRSLNASSEDPGTFTISASDDTLATTIAVRPAAAGTTVTPGVATLTLTPFVPTILLGGNQTATPGTAALVLSPKIPTVKVGVTATIGLATLTLTPFTPTVTVAAQPRMLEVGDDPPIDLIDYIVEGSLSIRETGYAGTGTMSVALTGPTAAFTVADRTPVGWSDPTWDVQFTGNVSVLRKEGYDRAGNVRYQLECQDYTTLLSRNVIDTGGVYSGGESDADRINAIIGAFSDFGDLDATTYVQTLVDVMPSQDFTGKTISEAMDMILSHSGGTWYIDFNQVLHTFIGAPALALTTPFGVASSNLLTCAAHGLVLNDTITFQSLSGGTGLSVGTLYHVIAGSLTADSFKVSTTQGGSEVNFTTNITAGTFVETATAVFGLSDAPDGVTTFGYRDLSLMSEGASDFKNRVYVIPGSAGNVSPAWYEDADSMALYGTYEAVLTADEVTTVAQRNQLAQGFLRDHALKRTGSLTMFTPGLHPQDIFELTNDDHGLNGDQFRVVSVETHYFHGTPSYHLEFGDPRISLDKMLSDDAQKAAQSAAVAAIEAYTDQREGSAFPSSPVADDRFYRADLGMWFEYTGTRWQCACPHAFVFQLDAGQPMLDTSSGHLRALSQIVLGGSDTWLDTFYCSFYLNAGTLNGSNKWVGTGLLGTVNQTISSGSTGVWRSFTQNVNTLLGSDLVLGIDWVKTGTPGEMYCLGVVTYRVVAT